MLARHSNRRAIACLLFAALFAQAKLYADVTLQVFFVIMPLQLLVGFGLMAVTVSAALIWLLDVYQDHLMPFVN